MSTSKRYLSLKNWFILNSAFSILSGLTMVIDPQILASPAGMILDDIGIHAFRGAGALYLGLGTIYWFGRKDGSSDTQKGILYGSFVFNFVVIILTLLAVSNGLITGSSQWINPVLGIILTAPWGYFIFKDRSRT